ncbi:MAG: hypothetical protein QOG44_2316 [Acidimicrobiaceae bacterium]|nr:hypothetical protein [Acidimicrobiaceae bacterium]
MAQSALTPAWEGFSPAKSLRDFSHAQLVHLLRARPDLASPPPKNWGAFVDRASAWPSIHACRGTLSRGSLQLLDALCLLPQPTTVDALVGLLDLEIDLREWDAALGRLVDLALVFRRGQELRVHPQLSAIPNPGRLGPPLRTALVSQESKMLATVAQRLGVEPGRVKGETLDTVVAALSDPDHVRRVLLDAPAGTAALAAQLADRGVATVPSGAYYIRPESPLGWLAQRGFLFATDWETVAMPREVALAVRGGRPFPDFTLRPPAVAWRPVDAASVDRASTERALRVVANLTALLDGWDDQPPKMLKAGGIGVRDIRRSASAIGGTETEAARLIELALVAGLAGWDSEETVAQPCPIYDSWLDFDVASRWATVAGAWMTTELHVNLAGATGVNGKPIAPMEARWAQFSALDGRMLVLHALLEGEPGQAADPASLAARVTWDAPGVWERGPAPGPTLISWIQEEAEVLGLCSSGALSSLGRAMVRGRVDDAVKELAAHAPQVTSQFVIQADLTAVATGPLGVSIREEIELVADLESSGAATVYRFSEQSLRRAFDAGRSASQILAFLTAHATKGVPQPLAYLVEDVGRRHGQVRVGSAGSYVRSDDPSLLAELLVARRAAKLELRQLAPTVLVSTAAPETVVATLRSSGYLPAEESAEGTLVIHRREVGRATKGRSPGWTERVGTSLDGESRPWTDDRDDKHELDGLIRRLLDSKPKGGSDPRPSPAPARRLDGPDWGRTPSAPAPIFPIELLQLLPVRPHEIAKSYDDILDLLELAVQHDWAVRFEYMDRQGRRQLMNATVYRINESKAFVVELTNYGTRTLTLSKIAWARVMTEEEEDAL